MKYIHTSISYYITEKSIPIYLEDDSMGYDIGEFLYHVTSTSNINAILKDGFLPKDGVSISGEHFKNRLYLATSLIATYDLSVNFGSYRDDIDYVIFKIKSKCVNDYTIDPLFEHGIYIDYKIDSKYIVETIPVDDLFGRFNDDDIDNLYS